MADLRVTRIFALFVSVASMFVVCCVDVCFCRVVLRAPRLTVSNLRRPAVVVDANIWLLRWDGNVSGLLLTSQHVEKT